MSEIKCGVARDLMPLVADDVASEESKALVCEHMEGCETCRAYYAGMTVSLEKATSQPTDTNFIRFCRKMEKRFKMKRTIIIFTIIGILLGAWYGAMFYFETRNYRIEITQENAKAQLFVENDGNVACQIEMAEGQNWYGNYNIEMIDGRYYLTPFRPKYTFMDKGFGEGVHVEDSIELAWENNQLYYRVNEWDMQFNEKTGSHEETMNERLIPVEYARWGHPDSYTTLYEKGEILPTYDELNGLQGEKTTAAPTVTQAP